MPILVVVATETANSADAGGIENISLVSTGVCVFVLGKEEVTTRQTCKSSSLELLTHYTLIQQEDGHAEYILTDTAAHHLNL